MADLRKEHDFNWAGAEAEFKRALEVNPNYATAHQWYGLLLEDVGRLEEARRQIETARGLDPLSLVIQVNVGDLYEALHEFDRAIDEYRKVEEMDPNFALAFVVGTNGRPLTLSTALVWFRRFRTMAGSDGARVPTYGGHDALGGLVSAAYYRRRIKDETVHPIIEAPAGCYPATQRNRL